MRFSSCDKGGEWKKHHIQILEEELEEEPKLPMRSIPRTDVGFVNLMTETYWQQGHYKQRLKASKASKFFRSSSLMRLEKVYICAFVNCFCFVPHFTIFFSQKQKF